MPYGDITGGRDLVDYNAAEIRKAVHSGRDAGRARSIDEMATRARAGDQAALAKLIEMADVDGPGGSGWATPDARNYNRLVLKEMGVDLGGYQKAGDGGGFMSSLGGVLKTAAPIAGMLIPGVGMVGAGAIGALGSAAGGALQGDKFNLGKTLLAGGAAAAGNKLLGNGLGSGSTNWGFGSSPSDIRPGGPTPGSGGNGSSGGAAGIPAGAPSSSPGLLDRFGKIGDAIQKYAPIGLGIAGAIDHAGQDNRAGQLRDQGIRYATEDWEQRAPLRQAALSRLLQPAAPRKDMSRTLADPTDPYRSAAA